MIAVLIGVLSIAVVILAFAFSYLQDTVKKLSQEVSRHRGYVVSLGDSLDRKLERVVFPDPDPKHRYLLLISHAKVRELALEPLYSLMAQLGYKWEPPGTTTAGKLVKVKK